MAQVTRNQCPHCMVRLDAPGAIRAPIRAIATYRLTPGGQLKMEQPHITNQGAYKCTGCGYRLNKYIKEVKVGIIGGKNNATPATTADV